MAASVISRQELSFPIVAATARKDAVSGGLDLKIGRWSNSVLDGLTMCPQRREHPLTLVKRSAVGDSRC